MNVPDEHVQALESYLSVVHERAIASRDEAQLVISEVRRLKEWLTKIQSEALRAELTKEQPK